MSDSHHGDHINRIIGYLAEAKAQGSFYSLLQLQQWTQHVEIWMQPLTNARHAKQWGWGAEGGGGEGFVFRQATKLMALMAELGC